MNGKRILLIEPHSDGHRMIYPQWMIRALREKGCEVTLATTEESLDAPATKLAIESLDPARPVMLLRNPHHVIEIADTSLRGLWNRHRAYYDSLRSFYRSVDGQFDHIHVPYLDYCDKAVSIFGSPFGATPWSGLLMRLSFHYPEMGVKAPLKRTASLEKYLFRRLLSQKTLRRMFVIDEPLADYTKTHFGGAAKKVVCFADPQDFPGRTDRPAALASLGLPPGRKIILAFGSLDRRKGLGELTKLLIAGNLPHDWDILMAGKMSAEDTGEIVGSIPDGLRGRVHFLNRFLTEAESVQCFSVSDAVWLRYSGHYGSSGVQALAAAAGLPIIATADGLIAWNTKRHHLGVILGDEPAPSASEWDAWLSSTFQPTEAAAFAEHARLSKASDVFGTEIVG